MIHKVKSGDTLSAIATKYGVTVDAIVKANSAIIKNANVIQAGWEIKIPAPASGESFQQLFNRVLKDIDELPSFKKLLEKIYGKWI